MERQKAVDCEVGGGAARDEPPSPTISAIQRAEERTSCDTEACKSDMHQDPIPKAPFHRRHARALLLVAAALIISAAILTGLHTRRRFHPDSIMCGNALCSDRVIVTMQPGASLSDVLAQMPHPHLVKQSFVIRGGRVAVLELKGGAAEAQQELAENPLVEMVEEDRWLSVEQKGKGQRDSGTAESFERLAGEQLVAAQGGPNDVGYGFQWNLHQLGLAAGAFDEGVAGAWSVTGGSRDVKVCVVDGGIDYTHPDLAPNVWINPGEIPDNGIDDDGNGFVDDVHGYNFAEDNGNPMETSASGHGTHVAGIVGAVADNSRGVAGVAPGVTLVGCKFLRENGSGRISDAIRCLDYCQAIGAAITTGSAGDVSGSASFRSAVEAFTSDVLFICSAGNDATNTDVVGHFPSGFDIPNLMAVAGSSPGRPLASYSNWGFHTIDLSAPGETIWSTFPGNQYKTMDGSSMAVPHVSGARPSLAVAKTIYACAAALLLSMEPDLSVQEVKALLMDSAVHSPFLEGKVAAGGLLHIGRAVATLRPLVQLFEEGETFDLEGHILHLRPAGRGFLGCAVRGLDDFPNPTGGQVLDISHTASSATVKLKHAFPLSGSNVAIITVHRNGVISFGEDKAIMMAPSLQMSQQKARLYAFWSELLGEAGSEVRVTRMDSTTFVHYHRMGIKGGDGAQVSFTVSLRSDGSATVAWLQAPPKLSGARVMVGVSTATEPRVASMLTENTADFSEMTSCWQELKWLESEPAPIEALSPLAAIDALSNHTICYSSSTAGSVSGCVDTVTPWHHQSALGLPFHPVGGLVERSQLPDIRSYERIDLLDGRTFPFAGKHNSAVFVTGQGLLTFSTPAAALLSPVASGDGPDDVDKLVQALREKHAVALLAAATFGSGSTLAVDYKQLSEGLIVTLYTTGERGEVVVLAQAVLRWDGSLCVTYPDLMPLRGLAQPPGAVVLAGASAGAPPQGKSQPPFWRSTLSRLGACPPREAWQPSPSLPAQVFQPGEVFDLAGRTLRFAPIGTSAMGVCVERAVATEFPVDPDPGAPLGQPWGSLREKHSAVSATVGITTGFPFLGRSYDSVVIASDGYLAFDSNTPEPLLREDTLHRTRRVAALFSSLDTTSPDSSSSLLRRADSLVVTYQSMPLLELSGAAIDESNNTFQIVLYRDGRIDLTFLEADKIANAFRAVGVGGGMMPLGNWVETDLSESPLCQATVLESFSARIPFDLAYKTLTFVPKRGATSIDVDDWRICVSDRRRDALKLSQSAVQLSLTDDDSKVVDFRNVMEFPFLGSRYTAVHVGSNGCLTFDREDPSVVLSASEHYTTKRISVFATDLIPSGFSGLYGGVWVARGMGKLSILYKQVELYNHPGVRVTFQVDLHANGRITMLYDYGPASVTSVLVGLSSGEPLSATWQPIDLTNAAAASEEGGACS